MIFPREFAAVGDCLAVVRSQGSGIGEPLTSGYVRATLDGDSWKASRLSYHLNKSPIPRTPPSLKEGNVLHSCDNGWCINPDHLSLGTSSQNRLEMYDRHPTIKQQRRKQGQERFKDAEYKEAMRECQRQGAIRQWSDPESRSKLMAGLRRRSK